MSAALCDDVILDDAGALRTGSAADAPLRTALRETFAGLSEGDREQLIARIAKDAALIETKHPNQLRRAMLQIREALRERHPICDAVKGEPRGLRVDGLYRIDATSYYVHGFSYDNESAVAAFFVLAPDGSRIDLHQSAFRHVHPDADGFFTASYKRRESGFIAFFQTRSPQFDEGIIVTQQNVEGEGVEARAPAIITDPRAARQAILGHCRLDRDGALFEGHIHPAIGRIQSHLKSTAAIHETYEIGPISADPRVSVIIPLFERIDLIEHQLAAMKGDADLNDAEIVYVLDSPQLGDQTREKLRQLHEQYQLRVRLLIVRETSGFAAAVNLGANLARGGELLILHSDVIPMSHGWLREMSGSRQKLGKAIVGATLLYHDGSIQHAGYQIDADTLNQPFKGLHRDLVNESNPRQVDAVSAAAMLIDREMFNDAGGFACAFAAGDFEDIDLCQRIKSTGVTSWILPTVRLYHLEGQSRSQRVRDLAQPYDRWLFARRHPS